MAAEWQGLYLAVALWKEDIRECKLLATLIMPSGEMPRELADTYGWNK